MFFLVAEIHNSTQSLKTSFCRNIWEADEYLSKAIVVEIVGESDRKKLSEGSGLCQEMVE